MDNTLKDALENFERGGALYVEGRRMYKRGQVYKKAADVCAFLYKCTNIRPFGVSAAKTYIKAATLCDLATDAQSKATEVIENAAEKLKTHSNQKEES